MSREEQIANAGSKIITIFTTIAIFTTIFTHIYRHADISFGVIFLLMMAGIFTTIVLNRILGFIWSTAILIFTIIKANLSDNDDFFDYKF